MDAPVSSTSRGVMAFTVAWVPTGMYTGVSISPWGVWRRPRRAPVCLSTCRTSNLKCSFISLSYSNKQASPKLKKR